LLHLTAANEIKQQALQQAFSTIQTEMAKQTVLHEQLVQLQQTVAQLTQTQQTNKDALAFDEARYFVKLANDHLQYSHNIALAIKLLELADQTLRDASGPQFVPLRQALANDIAHLQSIPQVDIDGTYARLAALHGEIDQLPLMNQPAPSMAPAAGLSENTLPWWQRGLQNTWAELRHIVIVRHQSTTQPFIAPDQKLLLYQNLHAQVDEAIWGLLHGEENIYLSSLNQMNAWVKQYFVNDDVLTQAVLTQINNLKNLYIHPAVPTLTAVAAVKQISGA